MFRESFSTSGRKSFMNRRDDGIEPLLRLPSFSDKEVRAVSGCSPPLLYPTVSGQEGEDWGEEGQGPVRGERRDRPEGRD